MIYSKTLPVIDVLNQLLHLLSRGLSAYVVEINPWMQPGDESLRASLFNLADDRRLFASRTIHAISDNAGDPDPGPFPLEYTGLNDVSIEYLAGELVDSLSIDIEILEALSAQLNGMPDLHALTQEILGNTKAHVEILEKMLNADFRTQRL